MGAAVLMIATQALPAMAHGRPVSSSSTQSNFQGILYYTRFVTQNYPSSNYGGTGDPVNVKSVAFHVGANGLTLGTSQAVATVPAADGIAFTPNGNLLVGGQNTGNVYTVNPSAGPGQTPVATPAGTPAAYMLGLDPTGTIAYVGSVGDNSGGQIGVVGLSPTVHTIGTIKVSGPDSNVDAIVFDNGQAFYTSGLPDQPGAFGSINLQTGVETPLLTNVPFAHGATFDPFTGDIILTGTAYDATTGQNVSEIAQVNPFAASGSMIVSTRQISLGNGPFDTFDLPWVDGQGQVFAAANDGKMVYVNYAQSGLVGSASDQVQTVYVASWLDDVVGMVINAPQFVIWGGNQPNLGGIQLGGDYNFWGAQWWKQITAVQPGDSVPSGVARFKGFADQSGTCGGQWTTRPGNSSNPPEQVGNYVSVIVTTNMFKNGPTTGGNIPEIVLLKVDNPGSYVDNPGHPLTGTMVAVLCKA